MAAAAPENRDERRRLAVLQRLGILDTPTERAFDDITLLAARILGTPIAALSLVDEDRQWFKSAQGLSVPQTERSVAFCDHTIRTHAPLIIGDALLDERFAENPLVLGSPHIRAYAGVPVQAAGEWMGALCVIDEQPREFTAEEIEALSALGRQVDRLFELRWRRALATAPQLLHVERIGMRIRSLADFDAILANEVRPAWLFDRQTFRFIAVNAGAIEQYGWSRAEFLSMRLQDIGPHDENPMLEAAIAKETLAYTANRVWRHERRDGTAVDVRITSAPANIPDVDARLVVVTDLTSQVHGQVSLLHAATHDALTGLPNRAMFFDAVATALQEQGASPIAVLYLDLDGFKQVNDTAGHATGDALLTEAATRVLRVLRDDDTVARLGGDEFGIVCPGTDGIDARELGRRVTDALGPPFDVDGRRHYVTVSIGVSVSTPGCSADGLVAEADAAMLAAKNAGRRRVALFDEELRRKVEQRAALEQDLHRCVERDQLELHYQPIVGVEGAVHVEALLRWHHPTRGLLAPGAFIEIAEESGLIEPIGQWVIGAAARFSRQLSDAGVNARVAFNLSPRQFNPSLVANLRAALEVNGADPRLLIAEVTESAVAEVDLATGIIRDLRALGMGVSIDDFGTGYSSLGRLRQLRVDALKLDQSFTRDVTTDRGRDMVAAIVQLARALGVLVVAEGVETDEELRAVLDLGCQYIQGYLIARPAPADEVIAFLRDRTYAQMLAPSRSGVRQG